MKLKAVIAGTIELDGECCHVWGIMTRENALLADASFERELLFRSAWDVISALAELRSFGITTLEDVVSVPRDRIATIVEPWAMSPKN
jgi:hypothetical protein